MNFTRAAAGRGFQYQFDARRHAWRRGSFHQGRCNRTDLLITAHTNFRLKTIRLSGVCVMPSRVESARLTVLPILFARRTAWKYCGEHLRPFKCATNCSVSPPSYGREAPTKFKLIIRKSFSDQTFGEQYPFRDSAEAYRRLFYQ